MPNLTNYQGNANYTKHFSLIRCTKLHIKSDTKWKGQTLTSSNAGANPTTEVHPRQLDKIPKPSATRQCEQEQGEWLDQWGDRHLGLFCPETGLTVPEGWLRGTLLTNLQGYGDSNRVNPPSGQHSKLHLQTEGATGWQPSRTCSPASKRSVTKTGVRGPQLARASLSPSRSKPKILPGRRHTRPCIISKIIVKYSD